MVDSAIGGGGVVLGSSGGVVECSGQGGSKLVKAWRSLGVR